MTVSDYLPSSERADLEEASAGSVPKIAVVLPDPITARACLDVGEAAALAVEGTLSAVHIGADPASMLSSAEEIDIQFLRERYEGTAGERVAQVRSVFDEWLSNRRGTGPVSWRDCSGDIDQCLDLETRDADLVIVPRTGNLDARDVVHGLLFHSHKLCLLPAYRQQGDMPLLTHVAVGWKPDGKVERTIKAALPWLRAARQITAICVDDDKGRSSENAAAEQFAALHVDVTTASLRSHPESVASALVGHAASIGATCIVAGAYRHGEFLEMIVGRVTRDLLTHAQVPLLLMH